MWYSRLAKKEIKKDIYAMEKNISENKVIFAKSTLSNDYLDNNCVI